MAVTTLSVEPVGRSTPVVPGLPESAPVPERHRKERWEPPFYHVAMMRIVEPDLFVRDMSQNYVGFASAVGRHFRTSQLLLVTGFANRQARFWPLASLGRASQLVAGASYAYSY
jgi:hypothetical protein